MDNEKGVSFVEEGEGRVSRFDPCIGATTRNERREREGFSGPWKRQETRFGAEKHG